MIRTLAALALLWIGAVSIPTATVAQSIVAIRDSVLDWNSGPGRSIPDAISEALGLPVENKAVSGAHFSNENGLSRLLGFDIQQQLGSSRPDMVIFTAGANDLGGECVCGACEPVLNSLVSSDLTGEIPAFVDALLQDGVKVTYVGYYRTLSRRYLAGCVPEFDALHDRMAALAARRPGLTFVSARDVMNRDDPRLYAFDRVHPSPLGSARIGAHVAAAIAAELQR